VVSPPCVRVPDVRSEELDESQTSFFAGRHDDGRHSGCSADAGELAIRKRDQIVSHGSSSRAAPGPRRRIQNSSGSKESAGSISTSISSNSSADAARPSAIPGVAFSSSFGSSPLFIEPKRRPRRQQKRHRSPERIESNEWNPIGVEEALNTRGALSFRARPAILISSFSPSKLFDGGEAPLQLRRQSFRDGSSVGFFVAEQDGKHVHRVSSDESV